MKRIFIIHGWGGNPKEAWLSWLMKGLSSKGIVAYAPTMPNTENPKIDVWIPFLKKIVGKPDKDTYFVGHSVGCQTIMRYLETINVKIGGVIFVAGFVNLNIDAIEEEEKGSSKIAKPWLETPLNWDKIKKHVNKVIAIFSDNDPYVPLKDANIFREKLGAKIIIEKNKGHFTESDVKEIPIVLNELLNLFENKSK